MENSQFLPASRLRLVSEFLTWLKWTIFLSGIIAVITFCRVNYFGAAVAFDDNIRTPILFVPNAYIDQAAPSITPRPRK